MKHTQRQARHDDHHALKRNKQILLPDQVALPALCQLRDTIHGPPEDADGSQAQGADEAFEAPGAAQLDVHGVLVEGAVAEGVEAAARAERKIEAQGHEDGEREDLEGEAGDHDVVAGDGGCATVAGAGGEAATGGLEDETQKIAGDKLELGKLVGVLWCVSVGTVRH